MKLRITRPPFAARANPAEAQVRSEVAAWSVAWGFPPSSATRLERADVARIASLTHPDAPPELFRFAVRIWAYAILLDDELDHCADPTDVIDAIMSSGGPTSPASAALAMAYRELRAELVAVGGDDGWGERAIADLDGALHGKRQERGAASATSIDDYLARRRAASFGDLLIDIIEGPRADVPDAPEYHRLVRDTLDAARVINDALSARRELAEDQEPINIVSVVRATPTEPLPTTIAHVDDLLRSMLRRMVDDRAALTAELAAGAEGSLNTELAAGAEAGLNTQPALDAQAALEAARAASLRRCVDGCAAFIRGVFDWHLEVARYRDPAVSWDVQTLAPPDFVDEPIESRTAGLSTRRAASG